MDVFKVIFAENWNTCDILIILTIPFLHTVLVYEMDSAVPIYQKALDGERILSTIFIPWTDLDSKKNPLTWQREARYYMITDKQVSTGSMAWLMSLFL